MFDPLSMLAFFAPVVVEAGKAAVQRFIAPDYVRPTSVADKVALDAADTDRLRVIADLDKPGADVSRWVNNVRAMLRPTIAVMVTTKWCIAPQTAALDFMVSSVWFYLFGERTFKK